MKVVCTLSICTFLFYLAAAAGALNPDRDIHQLAHRSWGEKDVHPGRGEALAQATDAIRAWIRNRAETLRQYCAADGCLRSV